MTRARVLAAINASKTELTTAQVAEALRAPRYAIGSALSKLAAYGQIKGRRGAPANGFLWSRKEGTGDEARNSGNGSRVNLLAR